MAGCAASPTASGPTAATSNANVKIINGKRYVWMPAVTGSNMPGRWVPEGSAVTAYNLQSANPDAVQQLKDSAGSQPPASGRGN